MLESWVIVLLKEMYLNSFIQEKNTQIATTLLFSLDLYKKEESSNLVFTIGSTYLKAICQVFPHHCPKNEKSANWSGLSNSLASLSETTNKE